jgi:hypothetical protein
VVTNQNELFVILPSNADSTLSILRATEETAYSEFKVVWQSKGFIAEPLVDIQRMEDNNVLSIFTQAVGEEDGMKQVVVLDFDLNRPERLHQSSGK